jgi:cytochrome b
MIKVRIWDLPTRMFHWALAGCVIGLVITGNVGGNAMVWHFRLGYAVFTLLLFRLVWGFVGGHWSRWRHLPIGPRQVRAWLGGASEAGWQAGHNPIGSWSVLAMLGMLSLQVATGLVSDDEIANTGPLYALVSEATVSLATGWHRHWGKLILIALVLLHVLAIAWYRQRKNIALVPAMWHGDKEVQAPVPASHDQWPTRWLALLILTCAALVVAWVVSQGG